MNTRRRTPALIGAAAVAALAATGCGSSTKSSTTAASTPAPAPAPKTQPAATPAAKPPAGASVVVVGADPKGGLKFTVSTLHAKAGNVTVRLADPASSGVPHGVAVQGNGVDKDSKIAQPGGTVSVTVSLKSGTYSFYCPVPGHEAAGMKGTLIVAERG